LKSPLYFFLFFLTGIGISTTSDNVFNVGILLALALTMVACGGKNESGSGSSSSVKNSFGIQTVTGTIDYSSMQGAQYFTAGNNQRYYIQDNSGAMRDAWERANRNGVFNNNNNPIKRVRMVGIFNNGQVNNQGNYGYNQQPQYNQQQQQMTVIPSSAEITNR
jgi:hypothetical protein